MISNLVWFTILLAMALYLFILLAIVVGRLGNRRALSSGADQRTRWLKSLGSKLENCWTCVSKFWFQVEPHEPSESKEATLSESSAHPKPGPAGLSCPLQRGKLVSKFCEIIPSTPTALVVRDEGPGFDPREVPDPTTAERLNLTHGRGIFLMRQLMDEVSYRDKGSEIELRKRHKE